MKSSTSEFDIYGPETSERCHKVCIINANQITREILIDNPILFVHLCWCVCDIISVL